MEVSFLPWDTDFFKTRIFSVKVPTGGVPELTRLTQLLMAENANIACVFVEDVNALRQEALTNAGAFLYDEKVTYGKPLPQKAVSGYNNVKEYKGEVSNDLLTLTLDAG